MALKFETEDETIEAAHRFERARYWRMVRELAKDAFERDPADEDKQYDAIHELVDSAVTYTKDQIDIIRFSEHDDAFEESNGELPSTQMNAYELYTLIAYWALHADVMDELGRVRDERRENPLFSDTEIHTWLERDRSHVELRNSLTGETIVEWWDEGVEQAIQDGFLNARDWHRSAYDYAVHVGLIKPDQEEA